jgi:hypothetical protein
LQGFLHLTLQGLGGQTSHLTGQGLGGQTSHFTLQGLGQGFENHEQGLNIQHGLQGFSHFTLQGFGGQTSHLSGQGLVGQHFSHLTGQGLGGQTFSHLTGQGFGGQTSHFNLQGLGHGAAHSEYGLQTENDTLSGQGFSHLLQHPPRANKATNSPLNQPTYLIRMMLLPFLEPLLC